jgi:hypothetical protein
MSDTTDLHVRPHGDRFAVWEVWPTPDGATGEFLLAAFTTEAEAKEAIGWHRDAPRKVWALLPNALPVERSESVWIPVVAIDPDARAENADLRTELKRLRDQTAPAPRGPPPSDEDLYRAAFEDKCDNRAKQDIYVQNIYGPLSEKDRVRARRLAGVSGTPGPKPRTPRRLKKT